MSPMARSPAAPRRTGQPGVGPALLVQLPDADVGLAAQVLDGLHQRLHRLPLQAVEIVQAGGGPQQQQGPAAGVELELVADPVTGHDGGAGVARQVQVLHAGHLTARDCVGRLELRTVGEHALADEAHRVVEQGVAPAEATACPA